MDDDDNELSQSESCSAKILTEGERIEDIFYLTDKNGKPISDPKVSRRSLKMNQPLLFFWGVFFVIIKVSSECPDWHYMQYKDDSCTWDDMKDQFTIARHALQIHIPQLENGDIACEQNGVRRYPRLDYSKGFPDWWWMQRMDIMVPSQHVQEGNRYAAEVTLAHFYEIAHPKNQVGTLPAFYSYKRFKKNFISLTLRMKSLFSASARPHCHFPARL
jgi:hypothetical protein